VKNVVAISLIIFLVPLAGCMDELSEPTKIELWEGEWHLAEGDFWRVGPAEGYGQFEWELTHIPAENESSDFTWNVYFFNEINYQRFVDGNLNAEYFVNGTLRAMDGNGTKGPFDVDSSDGYYLVVANNGNNENEDSLRFRMQFFGWK
tara:strand:+ start:295 stop:738 length:444 start_codon:yes stop_codon:yes gene_type:complete